jgi:hypothetical protein
VRGTFGLALRVPPHPALAPIASGLVSALSLKGRGIPGAARQVSHTRRAGVTVAAARHGTVGQAFLPVGGAHPRAEFSVLTYEF